MLMQAIVKRRTWAMSLAVQRSVVENRTVGDTITGGAPDRADAAR
jgi:hypothetical protein